MSEAMEEDEEVTESMVPQGESEESLLEKEAVPMTIPLSGDWPLVFWSLGQLVAGFRLVVTELAG